MDQAHTLSANHASFHLSPDGDVLAPEFAVYDGCLPGDLVPFGSSRPLKNWQEVAEFAEWLSNFVATVQRTVLRRIMEGLDGTPR